MTINDYQQAALRTESRIAADPVPYIRIGIIAKTIRIGCDAKTVNDALFWRGLWVLMARPERPSIL